MSSSRVQVGFPINAATRRLTTIATQIYMYPDFVELNVETSNAETKSNPLNGRLAKRASPAISDAIAIDGMSNRNVTSSVFILPNT